MLRFARSGLVLILVGLFFGVCAPQTNAQPRRLSEQSRITVVTILPGEAIHTIFGHSAVRVHDPVHDVDRLYNYGTFNFGDPFFIPKFTYGHLQYFLSVVPYRSALRVYRQQKRPVIEQELALSQTQRTALYRFLQHNARPEHRYYQYDFFFDNCSTRIRDALKTTLGDTLRYARWPNPNRSFRQLLDIYVRERPLLDLGFDLSLGMPADVTPSAQEAMFLPDYLLSGLDRARLAAGETTRPLVARTDTVLWIDGYTRGQAASGWPTGLSWTFLILVLGWTSWQASSGAPSAGRGDAFLFATTGLIGLIVCFLWFISAHGVTEHNWNLAWAWPTHLVAAALLLRYPLTARLQRYMRVAALATGAFVLGWSLWPQNLHSAVLPFALAVAVRCGWWALQPISSLTDSPSGGTTAPT
jgi:hypothetical protein